MLVSLSLAVFAGLLVYAALSDMARMIIPNWISIALAAAFPIAGLLNGMTLPEIGMNLAFGFGVLVLGFVLFNFNIFGGGDAKLLAAAATWTGLAAALPFLYWTVLSGGVLALTLVLARQLVKQPETFPSFVSHLLKKQNGIPYGVAIMAGGLMAIPSLPIVTSSLTLP